MPEILNRGQSGGQLKSFLLLILLPLSVAAVLRRLEAELASKISTD
jgi:hypothetical protein